MRWSRPMHYPRCSLALNPSPFTPFPPPHALHPMSTTHRPLPSTRCPPPRAAPPGCSVRLTALHPLPSAAPQMPDCCLCLCMSAPLLAPPPWHAPCRPRGLAAPTHRLCIKAPRRPSEAPARAPLRHLERHVFHSISHEAAGDSTEAPRVSTFCSLMAHSIVRISSR